MKRIIDGDREAFKEWMDLHIRAIERFAIQHGVTPKEAGKVAETVFRDLFEEIGQLTEEQLEEIVLFKNSIKELNELMPDNSVEGLFPFEEDTELHRRIIGLPQEVKIPFILAKFHNKSISDIAAIVCMTDQQVELSLQEALFLLDEPHVEKKLEFLNLSYQRLPTYFKESNIFILKSKGVPPVGEPKTIVKRRKPFILWGAGTVMIIALLFISVLRSDAYQKSSDERFIEKLNISFQQELDSRFELIGLSEPEKAYGGYSFVFQGYSHNVSPGTYGYDTKYKYKKLIRDLENQMKEGGSFNKKEAKQKYDELVFELRLPSEMVEQLQKDPLINDREQSLAFLDELYKKNDFLGNAYYKIVSENAEIVLTSDLVNDGLVDIDKLLEQKSSFPIELQNAIDGMTTQYYSLTSMKNISPLTTKYGTPELEDVLRRNLHPDMQIYITLLTGDLHISYTGTFEEHVKALLVLEDALPKIKESDQLIDLFNSHYILMFTTAAGFNSEKGIFDASGVVRNEIRDKWKQLASIGERSPSGKIIRQLINEMEDSNWKSSSYYEQLIEYGVWGELKKKMNEISVR
ncbi:hypothetical protein [Sporosarcina sp. Marseille-Q4943]|uniref:hypothetical protein n=1 Tax=Sporosarcina sp. Marseille-Q4943 TaxID=2942204 RepID=UPI00208DDBD9|nr:hypothetical protein [Sporosarcina sp. Marseille-Q4943]